MLVICRVDDTRADVCPVINHAGIEPWDSSRIWVQDARRRARKRGIGGEDERREVSEEGIQGKKGGKYPREPSADLCRPWLARWRPVYTFIPFSLSGPGERMRTQRLTERLSSSPLLLPFSLPIPHFPAPAGQRILQNIIRYAPKVDRWLLRSAKTSVPRSPRKILSLRILRRNHQRVISQRKKLPRPSVSSSRLRRRLYVRNNFRFS